MKTRTLLATTLASTAMASLLTFGNVAQADTNDGGHGQKYSQMSDSDKAERMQKRLDRMATKLGLSDEQKTKVQALKQNSKNVIKPLRDEQRALRTEIRALDPTATDFTAKLADAANRQGELTRQMIVARGSQRQQMASILTPEQLAKQKELRASRKGNHGKRKHRKHHGKHGSQQQQS